MISILVIDDHPLVAGGISAMLVAADGIEVQALAKTGREALEAVAANRYDIILLDINLPDMNGLALCAAIRKIDTAAKIIGLTSINETAIITQLLQRGGNGYLLKNMERKELLEAIHRVLDGKIYLSDAANEKILEQYRSIETATKQAPVLTRRELEVLSLLNDGLTGPDIAKALFISHHTVESHRKNLLQKFNASNLQQLLKLARQNKLID